MNPDRTEVLIREAFADAAAESVDPRVVQAELRRRSAATSRIRLPLLLATALAVIAAITTAVVLPKMLHRTGAMVGSPGPLPAQNLLLAGLDQAGWLDTVVLAHVGPSGTSVVSLPRDLLVDVPGTGRRDVLRHVYPQAVADARARGASPAAAERAGARTMAATVRALTGVSPEHYAFVRMSGIAKLADAVGGVPVCLRGPADDPYSGVHLRAGRHVLRGTDALAFLRQRHNVPNGDLDRVVRQQAFLRSLTHQLLSTGALRNQRTVQALLDIAHRDARTDPDWNLAAFAAGFAGLDADAPTRIGTAPYEREADVAGSSVLIADPKRVREFVAGMQAGSGGVAAPGDGESSGCVR